MEAVQRAEKVAQKNPTLPVLAGVSLEVVGNILTIRATNLDLGISIHVPVKASEDGHVVVPAQVFLALLNSLSKDKNITLSLKGQTLSVETKSTSSSMKVLPAEEFPIIPEIGGGSNFSIPAKDLVVGIKSVIYAASQSSVKPELSSVCLIHDGEYLVFVATDSFRLAEKRLKVKKIPNFNQILIPQKNAHEMVRILDGLDGDVSIAIEENQIAFKVDSLYLTSRTIDGHFPDYRQIIPSTTTTKAVVLKQDLVSALKTSLIFSDSFNHLKLILSPEDRRFQIESKNQDVGENLESVEAALEGSVLSTSVNHRYLTDCLPSIGSDSLALSFSGEGKPILLDGVGDRSFRYLLMPMNR